MRVCQKNNKSNYTLDDACEHPILSLNLYGKSMQDGIPTPETPVEIVSIGDDGTLTISISNKQGITLLAAITSGLPLCSVGDVCDELIYNADGTGKIIKHTKKVIYNGSENWEYKAYANQLYRYSLEHTDIKSGLNNAISNSYPQTNEEVFANVTTETCTSHPTGHSVNAIVKFATVDKWKAHLFANPLTVIYVLNTPQVVELSAAEMAELSKLNTFIGHTEIFNSGNAVMDVKYLGGYNGQAQTIGFWNSRKE